MTVFREILIALVAAIAGGAAVHTYYALRPVVHRRVAEIQAPAPPPATAMPPPKPAAPAPLPELPADPTVAPPAPMVPSGYELFRGRGLIVPVAGVRPEQITDTFHQARNGRIHEATDILAPRGTPVLAVDDGHIEKLFTSKQGGLTVYQFDPTQTYCYYYAHLDRYAPGLQEKQAIRKGDLLGMVGSTGNALPDAPHLHFALFELGPEKRWWEGKPLDPLPLWRSP